MKATRAQTVSSDTVFSDLSSFISPLADPHSFPVIVFPHFVELEPTYLLVEHFATEIETIETFRGVSFRNPEKEIYV